MRVSLLGTINAHNLLKTVDGVDGLLIFLPARYSVNTPTRLPKATPQASALSVRRVGPTLSQVGHRAASYYKQFGLPTVSIRPFTIFGPRQVGEGAVHHFINRAIRNEPLTIHGDGSQIRSWCYIDDIVDGVLATLTNEAAIGHAFNIGNPRSTLTIYHLAKLVVQLAGSSSRVEFQEMNREDVELRIPNIDKARELLGYAPRINLDEALNGP